MPLQDLTSSSLIPDRILQGLRLPRSPQGEPIEQVTAFLSHQPSLLILDNFEHLISNGATIVNLLLERAPSLTCLVTSRQPLGLAGEQEFAVSPLPVPGEGEGCRVKAGTREAGDGPDRSVLAGPITLYPTPFTLSQCPSVQLFVNRAQMVRPDFQLTPANAASVAALCAGLEGLPLAIELAAARIAVLTPAQMLARLGQRFDLLTSQRRDHEVRHRSLRAVLDWSYQLLSPELQQFFAWLSVFRGGWTLEAAEIVCEEPRALEYLEALRAGSLVLTTEEPPLGARAQGRGCPRSGPILARSDRGYPRSGSWGRTPGPHGPERAGRPRSQQAPDRLTPEMRFRFLETVREFARELLQADQFAALERRHADYYLALAEEAEQYPVGADQVAWLDRLEREHDNLRAALRWSVERGSGAVGLRLGVALRPFWEMRGYWAEGREWLSELLALPARDPDRGTRAKALQSAANLAWRQRDCATVQELHTESLSICREQGDRRGIADAVEMLGRLARMQADYVTARALHAESLTIRRALGDQGGIAESLNSLGYVAQDQRDTETARTLFEESLAIQRKLGHMGGIAGLLIELGKLACDRGDHEPARAAWEESLALYRELGVRHGIANSLAHLGLLSREQGDYLAVRTLWEENLRIQRELGAPGGVAGSLRLLGKMARQQGDHTAALAYHQECLAILRGMDYKSGIAAALKELAVVASARGQGQHAARLFGAAEALSAAIGAALSAVERAELEERLAAARAQLGEEAFTAQRAVGRTMPLDQVLAEALGNGEGSAMT